MERRDASTRSEPPPWLLPLDDAYIFVRYAQQLARGRFLEWSPGEPSSGASSPLFLALVVPPHGWSDDLAVWWLWSRESAANAALVLAPAARHRPAELRAAARRGRWRGLASGLPAGLRRGGLTLPASARRPPLVAAAVPGQGWFTASSPGPPPAGICGSCVTAPACPVSNRSATARPVLPPDPPTRKGLVAAAGERGLAIC